MGTELEGGRGERGERTECVESVTDETRDMAAASDVVGQGGPAEIEMAEAGPEFVIDLW